MKSAILAIFIGLICSVTAITPFQSAYAASSKKQDTAARGMWMDAFMKMKEADEALEGGKMALALELYEKAHRAYTQLSEKFPEWKNEMVHYRLNYTEQKVTSLGTRLEAADQELPRDELATMVATLKNKVDKLQEQSARAQEQLQATKADLEKARQKLAEEPAQNKKSMRKLQKELAAAQSKLKDIREEKREAQDKIRELEKTNKKLSAKLEAGDTETARPTAKLEQQVAELKKDREVARRERKAFKKQFEFYQALSEKRAKTIEQLRAELQQSQSK